MTRSEPEINNLAKDYAGFRQLMLDRLALLLPGGIEDQPADLQVMLLEMLAYTADQLSYHQDAVATEAYLGTARSRVSLRRHARLLCYPMHEGCNARVWIACQVAAEVTVAADWCFLTTGPEPVAFEPCHRPTLYPQHNQIDFVASAAGAVLAAGCTQALLRQTSPRRLRLRPGDLLLLHGQGLDAKPGLRHVVRLTGVDDRAPDQVAVTWHADDALPVALPIRHQDKPVAVVRANLVLADQGRTETLHLDPPVPDDTADRPVLPPGTLAWAEPLPGDFQQPADDGIVSAAAALLLRQPSQALPAITLTGEGCTWNACRDLLQCKGNEPAFVVETESDGAARLRFGDGRYGRVPAAATRLAITRRLGVGRAGNVGAETVTAIAGSGTAGVLVSNPLPASGGEAPELPERVRLFAPQAFRAQRRAVNADDYADRARRFAGVQRAAAEIRWTGSWYTVFVFVDRVGGVPLDGDFRRRLLAHIDGYRLAGYDLEIRDPRYVPLQIKLSVELRAGFVARAVLAGLLDALGGRVLSGARRGYFHADNWSFGEPVYLSDFYRETLAAPGVAAADVATFQRLGDTRGRQARDLGVIAVGPHEIVSHAVRPVGQLGDDGRLQITLTG